MRKVEHLFENRIKYEKQEYIREIVTKVMDGYGLISYDISFQLKLCQRLHNFFCFGQCNDRIVN